MKNSQRIFCLLLFFLLLVSSAAAAELFVGENLVYEFGWKGFTAARAEVTIDSISFQGEDCHKIVMKIESLPRLDWIWKVRDKIVAYSRKTDQRTHRYFYEQREGKFSLDTEVLLDKDDGILRSKRTLFKEGKTKEYSPKWADGKEYVDPISALMVLRKKPIKVKDSYLVKVFDGKRTHEVGFTVVGQESITCPAGTFDTFKLEPKLIRTSKEKADSIQAEKISSASLWVTTSEEHTIVRAESKTWMGPVYAELVRK